MKKSVFLRVLLVLVVLVMALTLLLVACNKKDNDSDAPADSTPTEQQSEQFKYKHDPRDNPRAMEDIVADETAIYGFRPSETGRIKMYASEDFSDPEVVATLRAERVAYHKSIESMYTMYDQMTAAGDDVETIARALSAERNRIRLDAYKDDPVKLNETRQSNLEKYGHEEGPLSDELYEKYGSWELVLEKVFESNPGADACVGLYDDYYALYVAIGQFAQNNSQQ